MVNDANLEQTDKGNTYPNDTYHCNCLGILKHGSLDNVLKVDINISNELENGEVLIKVNAFSFSKIDFEIVQGLFAPSSNYPIKLGYEFCGVIMMANNSTFKIGDCVYGTLPLSSPGSSSQYIKVPETLIAKKPKNLSCYEATAQPMSLLLAFSGLTMFGNLEGKNVLINGGGAISFISCQMARLLGAKSVSVISSHARSSEFSLLKINKFIPTTQESDILSALGDSDFIFDTSCNIDLKNTHKHIKKACFVSVNLLSNMEKLPIIIKLNPKIKTIILKPSGEKLADLNTFIETWKIRPVKCTVYDFKDYKRALTRKDTSKIDKIVLTQG